MEIQHTVDSNGVVDLDVTWKQIFYNFFCLKNQLMKLDFDARSKQLFHNIFLETNWFFVYFQTIWRCHLLLSLVTPTWSRGWTVMKVELPHQHRNSITRHGLTEWSQRLNFVRCRAVPLQHIGLSRGIKCSSGTHARTHVHIYRPSRT